MEVLTSTNLIKYMLPAGDKKAWLTCQLHSFVMGERHVLDKFLLRALHMLCSEFIK